MKYSSCETERNYNPPMLGNGDVVLGVDKEGTLNYERVNFEHPSGCVFRAGRRLMWKHDVRPPAKLLSFGTFFFCRGADVTVWEQELIETDGVIRSKCVYADDGIVYSTSVLHPENNVYALQKRFENAAGRVAFSYTLSGYDQHTTAAIEYLNVEPLSNGARVQFRMHGQDMYTGEAVIWLDKDCEVKIEGATVTLTASVGSEDTLCFYYTVEDDLFENDPQGVNTRKLKMDFSQLYAETTAHWHRYFEEGYVKTGDTEIDTTYRVALYHLKCFATRWSIPVGINNCSWDGKFFAFDEYYGFLGLLGANRMSLAKRVPTFRLNVCLDKAVERASKHTENIEQARFFWETSEYGEELAIPGFWYDHVFHMAVVAVGAFEYYEHSMDKDFLRECYRLIRACAQFYTQTMLYTDKDGGMFVGKCTDLERLGASVENAFMTSCGIIKTLECLVKAADILDEDKTYRDYCADCAMKLRQSLPRDTEKYLPYPQCEQRSIGVFAGKFPFDVLDKDDPYLLPAWEDFLQNESAFGNMYRVGKHVSSWYACWKAEAYARIGDATEAYTALKQSLLSVGSFCEMYEINEENAVFRPWFSTAAGVYLSALNEMLLQSDGDNLYICPAYPVIEKEIEFCLSAKGGAVVKAIVKGDTLSDLQISMKDGVPARTFTVYFRGNKIGDIQAV